MKHYRCQQQSTVTSYCSLAHSHDNNKSAEEIDEDNERGGYYLVSIVSKSTFINQHDPRSKKKESGRI
jgi:hypothetical protein